MRLINAHTLMLEEYTEPIPPYAILSHTWGQQELDFQDFQEMRGHERDDVKFGDSKIGQVCRIARQHGHGHVWVDTCCIDKSSTADMSEAVNSMYRYYQDAQVCYVYLADATNKLKRESLRDCRWFKRGWTLQELIAPQRVAFYDQAWEHCGDKTDPDLLRLIASITSIDEGVLGNLEPVTSFPVSKRMSWAADRCCTRQEDVAYSLMGIFDVNMPLLYGEGPKAFARLQEEISRRNLDLSLLAWSSHDDEQKHGGLLAKSPSEFRLFKRVTLVRGACEGQSEVIVVNGCLRISGTVFMRTSGSSTAYILDLGWIGRGASFFWRVGILLKKALGAFVRAVPQKLFVVRLEDVPHTRTLHMRMRLNASDLELLRRLPVDLAPTAERKPGTGPPPRYELEWGSYTATRCRTKQIETMYANGLCLDMRCRQDGRVLQGLEPWALRPTLFWKVWPRGNTGNATAVKVFLRYYHTSPSRRHSSGQSPQRYATLTGWSHHHYNSNPVPTAANNINSRHSASMLAAAAEPTRKRRRDMLPAATSNHPNVAWQSTNTSVLFPSRCLACPFYMNDKLRSTACKNSPLKTIQDVQQHLSTNHVHVKAPYCPVCGSQFSTIEERDTHIVGGGCQPQPPAAATSPAPDKATGCMAEGQHRRVLYIIRSAAGLADFQVWYKIWEELFPGERYPPSVWLGSETEEVSEITSLIWNRFVADMRGAGEGEGEDADLVKHIEMSRLSTMSSCTGELRYG